MSEHSKKLEIPILEEIIKWSLHNQTGCRYEGTLGCNIQKKVRAFVEADEKKIEILEEKLRVAVQGLKDGSESRQTKYFNDMTLHEIEQVGK